MPALSWVLMAGLLTAASVYGSNEELIWTSGLPLAFLLLLVVALTFYNRKLQKNNIALVKQQQALQTFFQQSDDIIAVLNNNKEPVYINPQLSTFLHTKKTDASVPLYVDSNCTQLLLPKLDLQQNWQGEAWLKTADNRPISMSLAITVQQQAVQSYLLLGRDISRLHLMQQQDIRDEQTGLLSPVLLSEYIQTCINFCNERQPGFALMLIKFNQLLSVHGSKPVTAQPALLSQLSTQLRALTNNNHILARYSQDTFAVIVPPHLCDRHQPEINLNRFGHKLLTLTDRLASNSSNTALQTVVGISVYPKDGKTAAELTLSAQNALQSSTRMGHSYLQFANASIQQRAPEYLALETELQKAILQAEFDVYFQPRISIGSNRVIGYEALLRWHSPKRGTVTPQHFLHIADDTGLITQLDKLVFKRCCEQLLQWQQTGLNRGRISLNIARETFCQNDFITMLTEQLTRSGTYAEQFELELHEDILLQPDAHTEKKLQQLNSLGFHLTLDNFGAGVSSLAALQRFPLHSLKIAPAFIKDMEHNEQQRNITASLIRLASYLQLDVIAIGIENEMQAYLLHVMGCDILQGHLFSKALPASEIPAMLARESKLLRKEVS